MERHLRKLALKGILLVKGITTSFPYIYSIFIILMLRGGDTNQKVQKKLMAKLKWHTCQKKKKKENLNGTQVKKSKN